MKQFKNWSKWKGNKTSDRYFASLPNEVLSKLGEYVDTKELSDKLTKTTPMHKLSKEAPQDEPQISEGTTENGKHLECLHLKKKIKNPKSHLNLKQKASEALWALLLKSLVL